MKQEITILFLVISLFGVLVLMRGGLKGEFQSRLELAKYTVIRIEEQFLHRGPFWFWHGKNDVIFRAETDKGVIWAKKGILWEFKTDDDKDLVL